MIKFNELNEVFCGNLNNFFELEDKYFILQKKLKTIIVIIWKL